MLALVRALLLNTCQQTVVNSLYVNVKSRLVRDFFCLYGGGFVERYIVWCLPLSLLLVVGLYWPGLSGPFLLDDFYTLQRLPGSVLEGKESSQEFLKYLFGGGLTEWQRWVAKLSFLLNDYAWPTVPRSFKWTNLMIHLLNGVLIFTFLRRLPQELRLPSHEVFAALVALLWLVHPYHVSTVLYVVQRMTLLSAMFVLLSINFLIFCSGGSFFRRIIFLFLGGGAAALAVFSKENAVIILPLLIMLLSINPFAFGLRERRGALIGLSVLTAGVCLYHLSFLGHDFEARPYGLWGRLEAQGRVLFEYAGAWFIPFPGWMSFYQDDLEYLVANGNYQYGLLAWLMHFVIIYMATKYLPKLPLIGLLWFYIAHYIESTWLPLEIKFEHRNYFPSVGLAIVGGYYFYRIINELSRRREAFMAAGTVCLLVSLLSLATLYRSLLWSEERILVLKVGADKELSYRGQYDLVRMLSASGFSDGALDTANAGVVRFNDLAMAVTAVNILCEENYRDRSKHQIILDNVQGMVFSSALLHQIEYAVLKANKDCVNSYIVGGDVADLLEVAESIQYLQSRKQFYAKYLDIKARYYYQIRNYHRTLLSREQLFQVQPTLDTALILANLYVEGGNLDGAKVYLDKARRFISGKSESWRDAEFNNLEFRIRQLENAEKL